MQSVSWSKRSGLDLHFTALDLEIQICNCYVNLDLDLAQDFITE